MTNLIKKNRTFFGDDFFTGRDPLFRELFGGQFPSLQTKIPETNVDWNPTCDIEETEKEYHFHFDVPGMRKDDFHIDLQDNLLTVSGERRMERREGEKNKKYYERFHGSFSRSFTLPTSVDPEIVEAKYEDGVLDLRIPKVETMKNKRISVK